MTPVDDDTKWFSPSQCTMHTFAHKHWHVIVLGRPLNGGCRCDEDDDNWNNTRRGQRDKPFSKYLFMCICVYGNSLIFAIARLYYPPPHTTYKHENFHLNELLEWQSESFLFNSNPRSTTGGMRRKTWPTFNGLFRPANVNSFMTIWFKSCVFAYFPRLIRHRYGRTNARAIGHQPEIQSTWTRSHASSLFRLCSLPSKILRFYPTARAVFFGAWTFLLMLTKVLVDCVIAVQPLASATLWTSTVYVHYTVTIGNIFGSYDN